MHPPVATYLRQQYAGVYVQPAMEANGMEQIFGKFELPDIYTPNKISLGPWNKPGCEADFEFSFLEKASYVNISQKFQLPIGSWLTSINGELSYDELIKFLSHEVSSYNTILLTLGPAVKDYLQWAIQTTKALDTIDLDAALKARPKTMVERMIGVTVFWLGMRAPKPIYVSEPFRGDVLTTFRIPYRADHGMSNRLLQLDYARARELVVFASKLNNVAERAEDLFTVFQAASKELKSFRELARSDQPDHPLYQFLDSEMMGPFNYEVFFAIFSRARGIANELHKQVWCATHQ